MMDVGVDIGGRTEYRVGYQARLAGMLLLQGAAPAGRHGWDNADTDRLEAIRHEKMMTEGLEDGYEQTWGMLFDAGWEACRHGISFDEGRTRRGRQVGSKRNLSWCCRPRTLEHEDRYAKSPALPLRQGEDPGAWVARVRLRHALWGERQIRSEANMTRQDARDFLAFAHQLNIRPQVTVIPLEHANDALLAVKDEREPGSVVLVP